MADIHVRLDMDGMKRMANATRPGSRNLSRVYRQWAGRYGGFVRRRFDTYSKGGGDWKPLSLATIMGRRATGKKAKTDRQKYVEKRIRSITDKGGSRPSGLYFAKALKLDIERRRLEARRSGNTKGARLRYIERQMQEMGAPNGISKGPMSEKKLAKIRKLEAEASRIRWGVGVSILRDTGVLFNALSVSMQGQPLSLGNLVLDIPNGVRFGFSRYRHSKGTTIADIASYHNAGGTNGRPPMRAILVQPDSQTMNGMMTDLQVGLGLIARGATA